MWAWATMTSMVENMSELLVGSYVVLIPCLTRPGITRRISFVECANAGGDYRSRTWCLSSGFRLGLRAKVAVI